MILEEVQISTICGCMLGMELATEEYVTPTGGQKVDKILVIDILLFRIVMFYS